MRLRAFVDLLAQHRHPVLAGCDAGAWIVAAVVATLARLDVDLDRMDWPTTAVFATANVVLFTAIAWITRLHDGRARLGSLDEMVALAAASAVVGTVLVLVDLAMRDPRVPRSVPVITALVALVLMAVARAGVRMLREHGGRGELMDREPVLVIGGCDSARQLIRSMRTEPGSRWRPVGILDDDLHNRYLRIEGVPVLGTCADLPVIATQQHAHIAVVADPGASPAFLQRMSSLGIAARVAIKVLPGVTSVLSEGIRIRDIRDIALPDLLGRHQLDVDLRSSADYLTGRRVLVTGAGGSIGSELCRQISRCAPAELIMLDRDESALHEVQLSITRRAMLDSPDLVLADIRDEQRIREVFLEHRPQIVFHAAALKHLPLLEQYPREAVKTNILGTLNVLEAARQVAVHKFVNISTDKAAKPISVLGYSKRITERLTAAVGGSSGDDFLSVRFGNVLGSRGSVLNAFAAQISARRPVTVTHPDVTRYFMTVSEAVQLVIHAAAMGRGGEALVLDMGEPVRIDDVARHLIQSNGSDVEIHYTGLRVGEKLNEDLFGDGEIDHRPQHHLVSHVPVPPLDPAIARELAGVAGRDAVLSCLREVARAAPVISTRGGTPAPSV